MPQDFLGAEDPDYNESRANCTSSAGLHVRVQTKREWRVAKELLRWFGQETTARISLCKTDLSPALKSEKRGVQAARNGPSADRKCWQRVELGIHGQKAGAATGLEKSEKRGVQAARNGPRRGPEVLASRIELGIRGLKSWGRNWSRKVRETRSSSSQKRSEPAAMRGQGGNEHGGLWKRARS